MKSKTKFLEKSFQRLALQPFNQSPLWSPFDTPGIIYKEEIRRLHRLIIQKSKEQPNRSSSKLSSLKKRVSQPLFPLISSFTIKKKPIVFQSSRKEVIKRRQKNKHKRTQSNTLHLYHATLQPTKKLNLQMPYST